MKLPSFKKLCKFRLPSPRPKPRRLEASARRVAPAAIDDSDEYEPTTRISAALVVVLILHVVALSGIYFFNQVKHTRQVEEDLLQPPKAATQKPALAEGSAAPQPVPVSVPLPATPPASLTPISGSRIYHVRPGDTFMKISSAFGVSTADLAASNGLKETSTLHLGQTLNIPAARTAAKSTPGEVRKLDGKKPDDLAKGSTPLGARTYTVKKGDSPVSIARSLSVSQDELLKLNKIDDPKKLQIGIVLKVPPSRKAKSDPDRS